MKKVKIKEIAEQIRGVSYTPADAFDTFSEDTIPLLRANNIQNSTVNYNDLVYVRADKVGQKQLLNINDILICASSGSKHLVGKACVIKEEYGTFGAFCKVLRPNSKMINPAYFSHYFQSAIYRKTISELAAGANINNIKNEHLDELAIALPNMPTQEGIARKLDAICRLITLREQQLKKLDQLASSRFIEMFGDPIANPKSWTTGKLSEVTDKIGSGATPQGGKESYITSGISLIRSMNIHNGKFEYKDLAHITEEQAQQLNNVNVKSKDVFINITGASVARSCVVPDDVLPARVNQHVSIIRCKQNILNPIFANSLFISLPYQRTLLAIGESGGATRQAITKQQLENLMIILPSLELQNEFSAFVEQLDKSKVIGEKQRFMLEKITCYDIL